MNVLANYLYEKETITGEEFMAASHERGRKGPFALSGNVC